MEIVIAVDLDEAMLLGEALRVRLSLLDGFRKGSGVERDVDRQRWRTAGLMLRVAGCVRDFRSLQQGPRLPPAQPRRDSGQGPPRTGGAVGRPPVSATVPPNTIPAGDEQGGAGEVVCPSEPSVGTRSPARPPAQ